MGKFLFNVVLYGFLGYILERIINLVFLGEWVDNRVLHLPVQPMYGLGVALTLVAWSRLRKWRAPFGVRFAALVPLAIVFTAVSELLSGHLHEQLFNRILWDYRHTFSLWCNQPYSCVIPTGIFGFIAACVSVFLQPLLKVFFATIPALFRRPLAVLTIAAVGIDFLVTYTMPFLTWIGVV